MSGNLSSGSAASAASAASAGSASAVSSGGTAAPLPAEAPASISAQVLENFRRQIAALGQTVADHTAFVSTTNIRLQALEKELDALTEHVTSLNAPASSTAAPATAASETLAQQVDFCVRVLRDKFPAELAPGAAPPAVPAGPKVNYVGR